MDRLRELIESCQNEANCLVVHQTEVCVFFIRQICVRQAVTLIFHWTDQEHENSCSNRFLNRARYAFFNAVDNGVLEIIPF